MTIKYLLKNEFTKKDYNCAGNLEDAEFEMKNDSNQIQLTDVLYEDLLNNPNEQQCIIKKDDKIIGMIYSFVTSKDLMNKFISGKINERELLFESRKNSNYESIYLCDMVVIPEYRGKGLMTNAGKIILKNIINKFPSKNIFCWIFSIQGKKMVEKFAKEFNLEYFEKKH